MTKIGVTGANGMVGKALRGLLDIDANIEARYIVRGTPRLSGDVKGPDLGASTAEDWREAVAGLDTVLHLAAGLPWTVSDAAELRRINVEGTRALAEAAIAAGVSRFVYVSTLGVHGVTSGDAPFTPDSAIRPSGVYAETKYEAEQVLEALCADAAMQLVILRPPIVYGPGVAGKVGALADRIAKGARLPLGKIDTNRRQMISAANLADALVMAARHPDAPGAPLLTVDAEGVSTHAFVSMLAEAAGKPLRLMPVPSALFRILRPLPVIGGLAERLIGNVEVSDPRLTETLGWTPPHSLRDGVADIVKGRGA